MTDWKVQGSLPPMTHEAWMVEFERYKLFPEWQQRKSMTLDEFKVRRVTVQLQGRAAPRHIRTPRSQGLITTLTTHMTPPSAVHRPPSTVHQYIFYW